MRYTALRGLTAMADGRGDARDVDRASSSGRTLHRGLGELAMDVLGPWSRGRRRRRRTSSPRAQRLFLYTRADTIYGGSNEIQRNIIGERVLGLPPEPKVV